MENTTIAKLVLVADTAIHTAKVSDLLDGDVILVPGKGKRAVRAHSNGKVTLVFPKSGKVEVDGKKAGSLADLGGHDPAVVGKVEGGWVTVTTTPKAATKDEAPKGRLTKGSPEAKARMAKARAARSAAPKVERSTNAEHFAAALDSLGQAIDHLRKVEF